ncbi:MAG: hypothetical protein HYW56_00900 [Candidatus Harrisonbacteria bacterium]|nr:hypothetical protein [Candidatus Harrisonbacteria bacterium]
MLIYLYGPDSYRRGRYLRGIRAAYAEKHSVFTMYEHDASEEDSLHRLQDAAAAQSLFSQKKFIVVSNLFPIAAGEEKTYKKFLEALAERSDVVVAIVSDDAPPKAFTFLLDAAKPCKEFPVPHGSAFERFIREEAGLCGARLTPTLLRELAETFDGDTWGAAFELQKIASGGTVISERGGSGAQTMFGALMQLANRPAPQRAVPLLERLLQSEDSAKLFNILASRVGAREKMRFANYDIAVKTGKTDYALALTDYVLIEADKRG